MTKWSDTQVISYFKSMLDGKERFKKFEMYRVKYNAINNLIYIPINAYLFSCILNNTNGKNIQEIGSSYKLYDIFYSTVLKHEMKKFDTSLTEEDIFNYHFYIAKDIYDRKNLLNEYDFDDFKKRYNWNIDIITETIILSIMEYNQNMLSKFFGFIHESIIDFILVKKSMLSILKLDNLEFLTILYKHFDIKFFEEAVYELSDKEKRDFKANIERLYYHMLDDSERNDFISKTKVSVLYDENISILIKNLLKNIDMDELKNRIVYCYGKVSGTLLRNENILEYIYYHESNVYVRLCAALASIKHGIGTRSAVNGFMVNNIELSLINNVLSLSDWNHFFRSLCLIFWSDTNVSLSEFQDDDCYDWSKVRNRTLQRLSFFDKNDPKKRKFVRTRAVDLLILYIFHERRQWKDFGQEERDLLLLNLRNLNIFDENKFFIELLIEKFAKHTRTSI